MRMHLCRSVVALAAAFACLALMAVPASAHTHTIDVTGGTFSGVQGGYTVSSSFVCPTTLALDVDHEDHTGDIVAFNGSAHFIRPSGHYVAVVSRTASTPGTVSHSGTTGSIISQTVSLALDVYFTADQTSTGDPCVPTGSRLCRWRVTFHIGGTYTHDPENESLAASDTVALSSGPGTVTAAIGCQGSLQALNGGVGQIPSLTGHVAT